MDVQHTARSGLGMESYSLRNMYLSVFVVKTAYIYIAMNLAWSSLMIPYLETTLTVLTIDKVAILGSLPLGMMLGPTVGYFLAPRYGYKSIFLLFGILSLLSVLLLSFVQVWIICLARIFAGVATGAVLCYAGSYIKDIAEQEVRVVLRPLYYGFTSLGFLLVYANGSTFSYFEMLLMLAVVPVSFLICLTWLPESPYIHVANGNMATAEKSIDFLHRGISTRGLDQLMLLIQEGTRKRGPELFLPPFHKDPKIAKANLTLFVLLSLTGFPVLFMFMEPLIREVQKKLIWNSLFMIATVSLPLMPVVWMFHACCSSRTKMATSSTLMSLFMAILGVFFFYFESGQDVSHIFFIPTICLTFYAAAFLVGFVDKQEEEGTDRCRDCGRVVALSAGFFSMFLNAVAFLPVKEVLGTATILWFYSVVSVIMTIFIIVFKPKGTLF
ncbi:facilitated trehalose transporter Tret1-2 homolog [Macrosteles quadrilineatus]|uniref:facilitated trehalose transporter Tret1-2 homolog n=1 Tax=Macrosteles quadrilineatus TaxID=74068 RepID=UPI0023E155C7|nr:facilitated trehalose transporter Tret1-2 homolog [Macrosteles quadrilineatus]